MPEKITATAGQPFTLTLPGEARWTAPNRPDATGPSCTLTYSSPGVRTVKATVTTTVEHEFEVDVKAADVVEQAPKPVPTPPPAPTPPPVIVVGQTPGPIIKLHPGPQTFNKTVTIPGTRIVALDPSNPPLIRGGIAYYSADNYVENLIFDGETNRFSWSIKLGEGGGCSGENIEFRRVNHGLFCETTKALGGTWMGLKSGPDVERYVIGLFGAKDVSILNPRLLNYRGDEHPIRINGQGGVASKNIRVIGGEITRTGTKEPLTIRHGEDVLVRGMKMKGSYALRIAWEKGDGQADVQSKRVTIEDCDLYMPIHVQASGVDTLLIKGNRFHDLNAGHAEAIHLNPYGGRTKNVTIQGNTRDTAGAMVKGERGIEGFRLS